MRSQVCGGFIERFDPRVFDRSRPRLLHCPEGVSSPVIRGITPCANEGTLVDVLVEEANRALRSRGYSADEAAVYPDQRYADVAVLRGSLVKETFEQKGEMLLLVSQFPERDDLVAIADQGADASASTR